MFHVKLSYDLHIHSCLSPCGDNDMTPNNIVNMAILGGLDIIALTDHNSCKNCAAFCSVAQKNGILAIPGMELCTNEEIHVVCLFETLEAALGFDREVYSLLPNFPNDTKIFGDQLILDEFDNVVGTEPRLLINAADISISDLPALVARYGGTTFPAHIDRSSYSVLSSLGFIPPECGFMVAEIKNPDSFLSNPANREKLGGRMTLTDSDAHYLWDIAPPERFLELPACSANSLLGVLRAGKW